MSFIGLNNGPIRYILSDSPLNYIQRLLMYTGFLVYYGKPSIIDYLVTDTVMCLYMPVCYTHLN